MPRGCALIFTSQQDEIIRKCWQHNHYGHHAAKRAAQLLGLSADACHRRAMRLGLVFSRERHPWSRPELDVVEANAHQALETIQRKLQRVSASGVKRTRAAIAAQINLGRFRTNMDGLKHGPLAAALGISHQKLAEFRESGFIAGERLNSIREDCGYKGPSDQTHLHWFYPNAQIVRLLFEARGEIDWRKVNHTWLLAILEPFVKLPESVSRAKGRHMASTGSRTTAQSFTDSPLPLGLLDAETVRRIRSGRFHVLTRSGKGRTGSGDGQNVKKFGPLTTGASSTATS